MSEQLTIVEVDKDAIIDASITALEALAGTPAPDAAAGCVLAAGTIMNGGKMDEEQENNFITQSIEHMATILAPVGVGN